MLFFKRKTVDDVLKQFTKILTALRAVQAEQEQRVEGLAYAIAGLENAQKVAVHEAYRASQIASRIEAIVA